MTMEQQPDNLSESNIGSTTRLLRIINDPAAQQRMHDLEIDIDMELEDLLEVEGAFRDLLLALSTSRPELDGRSLKELLDPELVERASCALDDILNVWAARIKDALQKEF